MYKLFFTTLLLCLTLSASAFTVYKKVNKDGTVTYSDKPFPGAQKVTLPPANPQTTPAIPEQAPNQPTKEKPVKAKLAIEILSPTNGDSIRNNAGELTIMVQAQYPPKKRYVIQLLINDKPYGKASKKTKFELKELDRGIINIKAQLQTRHGKILAVSKETVVYMHKTSIIRAR